MGATCAAIVQAMAGMSADAIAFVVTHFCPYIDQIGARG